MFVAAFFSVLVVGCVVVVVGTTEAAPVLLPGSGSGRGPTEAAAVDLAAAATFITPAMRCAVCVVAAGMYQRDLVAADGNIPFIPLHVSAAAGGEEHGRLPFELAADEVVPQLWRHLPLNASVEPEALCEEMGVCAAGTPRLWRREKNGGAGEKVKAKDGAGDDPHLWVKTVNRKPMRVVQEEIKAEAAERRRQTEFPPGTNCEAIRYPDVGDHLPVCDDDFDKYSTYRTLRGYQWRGRDCNDQDGTRYPGRRSSTAGPEVDHNCNGIFGVDAASGTPYEDLYCNGTDARGVVIMGDSLSATFMIPIYNLQRGDWAKMAFGELGWPQCSWGTGFVEDKSEWCARENLLPADPIDSIYLRLRERNLCNHRDYQDHSWLGARSPSQLRYVQNIARTKEDHPLLVLYSMFANDICNSCYETICCTTPADFESNIRGVLDYLNANAPNGTDVVLMGHMQGEIIWDTLVDVYHPILSSLTYGWIFQFVAELGISPCAGWLNDDAAIRAAHTDWAESLDAVCASLAGTTEYPSLNVHYLQNPMFKVFRDYDGPNETKDLFTYVDGGHWNIEMETLFARQVWADLEAGIPQVLGPVNQNNNAILARFGNQGGH